MTIVPVRLVIFDCDGTLVDSQHTIVAAMEWAFAGAGLASPERNAITRVVGLSLGEAVSRLVPDADEARVRMLAEAYKAAFAELRRNAAHEEPMFPGVRDALFELARRENTVLAMATGKSRRGVDAVLEREGFHGVFQSIQTADTHPSKPHPSMVLAAMAEAGARPRETVMIGDTTYDIEMALGAGAAALGVAWGYHDPLELKRAGAHAVVDQGAHLVAAIDRLRHSLEAAS